MINNPELIKKIIEQIENIPKDILDEAIIEVIQEDIYNNILNDFPKVSYKEENFFFDNNTLNIFDFLHKNSTGYNIEEIMEDAA